MSSTTFSSAIAALRTEIHLRTGINPVDYISCPDEVHRYVFVNGLALGERSALEFLQELQVRLDAGERPLWFTSSQ